MFKTISFYPRAFCLVAISSGLLLAGCSRKSNMDVTSGQSGVTDTLPGEKMGLSAVYTKMTFTSDPPQIKAGQTAHWTLRITDAKTGAPIQKFLKMHDKLLHLVVVSRNLSFYDHIHPTYKGNGIFTISYALPRAGQYRIYADYVTAAMQHEVPHHDFDVAGANPLSSQLKFTPDQPHGMWITKHFRAHDEGKPPLPGATEYEVAMMPMPSPVHVGDEAMLHFEIRNARGKPLTDLQPYMGAMGHAVILSADGSVYLHTHPMNDAMAEMMFGTKSSSKPSSMKDDMAAMMEVLPPGTRGGPDIMFHTKFPKPGFYRIWGQFMHANKVITSDYTLFVLPAQPLKGS